MFTTKLIALEMFHHFDWWSSGEMCSIIHTFSKCFRFIQTGWHFSVLPMNGTWHEVLNGSQETSVTVGVTSLSMLYVYFFLSSQNTLTLIWHIYKLDKLVVMKVAECVQFTSVSLTSFCYMVAYGFSEPKYRPWFSLWTQQLRSF